jgi:hypothetical protein
MNAFSGSLAQLGAGLAAVKAALAVEMNPNNPREALEHFKRLKRIS